MMRKAVTFLSHIMMNFRLTYFSQGILHFIESEEQRIGVTLQSWVEVELFKSTYKYREGAHFQAGKNSLSNYSRR